MGLRRFIIEILRPSSSLSHSVSLFCYLLYSARPFGARYQLRMVSVRDSYHQLTQEKQGCSGDSLLAKNLSHCVSLFCSLLSSARPVGARFQLRVAMAGDCVIVLLVRRRSSYCSLLYVPRRPPRLA